VLVLVKTTAAPLTSPVAQSAVWKELPLTTVAVVASIVSATPSKLRDTPAEGADESVILTIVEIDWVTSCSCLTPKAFRNPSVTRIWDGLFVIPAAPVMALIRIAADGLTVTAVMAAAIELITLGFNWPVVMVFPVEERLASRKVSAVPATATRTPLILMVAGMVTPAGTLITRTPVA
jgi:hypothetical protein